MFRINKKAHDPKALTDSFTLLNETISIFKEKYRILFLISLFPAAIDTLLYFVKAQSPTQTSSFALLLNIINFLVTITASIALMYAVKEKIIFKEAFQKSISKVLPYLLLILAVGLATIVGFIFLIVPGVVILVWLVFAPYILVFEKKGIIESLKKSREYVKGYWFAVLGKQIFLFIVLFIVYILFGILSYILVLLRVPIASPLLNFLVTLFVTPIGIIYMYLVYKNIKSIKTERAT